MEKFSGINKEPNEDFNPRNEETNINETSDISMEKELMTILKEKFSFDSFNFITKGGFGSVYEIKLPNSMRYAVKCIKSKISKNDSQKEEITRKMINSEIFYSLLLNHKNCLRSFSKISIPDQGYNILVMQYAENGDLSNLMKIFHKNNFFITTKCKKTDEISSKKINQIIQKPNSYLIRFFFKDIVQGIKYLVNCSLVHLDLKPKNILLNRDFTCKIADFFTTMKLSDLPKHHLVGTVNYMSPEIALKTIDKIDKSDYSKMDIFSLGCTLYRMVFNKDYILASEISNNNLTEFFYVKKYKELEKDKDNDKDLYELLLGCLNPNINNRFSINKIIESKWMNEIKDFRHYMEMNLNHSLKYLLEIQKIQHSNFLKNKNNLNIFEEMEGILNSSQKKIKENIYFELVD